MSAFDSLEIAHRLSRSALAERILKDMKATKHGVLDINEKDSGKDAIAGGGPSALRRRERWPTTIWPKNPSEGSS